MQGTKKQSQFKANRPDVTKKLVSFLKKNAAEYPETKQFHQEIWGSPAIDADGTIYIGPNAGKVHALDPKTGKLKCESERTDGEIFGAPVIDINGEIYVRAEDHYLYVYQPLCLLPQSLWHLWRTISGRTGGRYALAESTT